MQTATTNLKSKRKKVKQRTPDYILLALILLIAAFGVVMVYSASFDFCTNNGNPPAQLAIKQLALGLVGVVAMLWVTYRFDYHICTNRMLVKLFYYASIILAFSVRFIGKEVKGAKRWIALGPIQIQPSEFVKLAVVLMLTSYIIRNRKNMHQLKVRLIAWAIVAVPALIVIVAGKNLSSGIVIFGIGAMIIFTASPKVWYYFFGIIVAVLIVFGARYLAKVTPKGQDPNVPIVNKILVGYRLDRVRAWLDPFTDPQDDGYQAIQALYAIGSGGFFGVGLGHGIQKQAFLPEPYNDIIFAVICEELGLIGALILMIGYGLIVIRGMTIAMRAPDYTGAFMAVGITSMIGIQAIINVAVNTNTIPTTGMQLPLVSYGGTALVVLLTTLGLLLNISRFSSIEKIK